LDAGACAESRTGQKSEETYIRDALGTWSDRQWLVTNDDIAAI
jgi:hypothetical protein